MSKYHAVSIEPSLLAPTCPALHGIENVRFLANEAPMIPLPECDQGRACDCRYKHFDDRRQDERRDADIGLPGLPPPDHHERRSGPGRRGGDAA